MKTKRLLLLLGLPVLLSGPLFAAEPPASGQVEVKYVEPENFTDLKDSYGVRDRVNEAYLRELTQHVQRFAGRRLRDGQRLVVTITDIDMAGDFEPWRSPQFQDVRIVKDIYPPRIDLTFQLLDGSGAVVSEGERELRNLAFNLRATGIPTNDPLRHEKALLEDWMRREFRVAKK